MGENYKKAYFWLSMRIEVLNSDLNKDDKEIFSNKILS